MNARFLTSLGGVVTPLVAVLSWVSPVNAQQFVSLPQFYMATDVTPDGEIVVGYANPGGFIWKWRQDPAPTVIPGAFIEGTSDDGTVLTGNVTDPATGKQAAGIWTQAAGWQSLGGLPGAPGCDSFLSSAYGISGDGTVIVGLAWASICQATGFRWTAATGMQPLQLLANGSNRCNAVSRNGSAIGGFAQGNSGRTPAYWNANLTGSVLNPNFQGEVYGFNNDGSLSVGCVDGGAGSTAYIRNQQTGVITPLGTLNPNWNGNATDISEDGNVVVGWDNLMVAGEAWVWTSSDGIISINNRLAALGISGVPPLRACLAVNDAGTVMVGGGAGSVGFIVELPGLEPYGTATAGCTGLPVLTGAPWPSVNTPSFTLTSTNAPPASLGLVLITNAADLAGSDPFALGVQLHVDLFASTETIPLDATSDLIGIGTAPAAIPNNPILIGKTYYAQILWAWQFSSCFVSTFNLSTTQGLAITILP